MEKFGIFREKFSIPKPQLKMADSTQPDPSNKKIFDPDPSLVTFDPRPNSHQPDALNIR